MTIDIPKIDRAARPATGAEHVEPRCSCNQRRPDRRRPQHVTAGGEQFVPALDHGLRLGVRGLVGSALLRADLDIEASRTNPHGGSIGQLPGLSRP
jgi:hypothetical protein